MRTLFYASVLALGACASDPSIGDTNTIDTADAAAAPPAPNPPAPAPQANDASLAPHDASILTDASSSTDAGADAPAESDAARSGDSSANNDATTPPMTCGGGGGPIGGPADLFPCDSTWYKDVSQLPVASESASIIAGIGSWGAGGRFMIDTSIKWMHSDGSAPKVTFTLDYQDESNTDPVPIPPGGALEGESGYECTGGGDCHLIVVDDSAHKLYELYSATNGGGSAWHAAQESVWDLTKHYGPDGRGLGCTSADAAGLAVMAGLIGLRETKAGDIRHALRFILPNSAIRTGPSFVTPATHGTSATSSSTGPAYGTRLRLRASFDESTIASSGGKAVVRALKKYGMLLADGGQYALTAEDESLENQMDPSLTWTGLLGASDLAMITPQDFEVVDLSPVQVVSSCTLM